MINRLNKEELNLIKKLLKISEEKNQYVSEEELFSMLKRADKKGLLLTEKEMKKRGLEL